MKKLLLIAAAALAASSLSACNMGNVASTPPAPLQGSVIDEQTLLIAIDTYDTALTAVDKLVSAGVIVKGSERALALKAYLGAARNALNAAGYAQRAGSASDYLSALNDAKAALAEARKVIAP